MTVAGRRLVDLWRSESARRRREQAFTLEASALQATYAATQGPGAPVLGDEVAPDTEP